MACRSILIKRAQVISILGHPLLMLPLCALALLFRYESVARAGWVSLLLIGGLFVPLGIIMYRRQARGVYTNFDVSDQQQRQSWYWLALSLVTGITLITYLTGQAYLLRLSLLLATGLLATAQLLNRFIKSSLHVSLNMYLAFLLLLVSPGVGLLLLAYVPLIGWARWRLGRHTLVELVLGSLLGSVFGGLLLHFA